MTAQKEIEKSVLIPSAALTVKRKLIKSVSNENQRPIAGDLVYCSVDKIGQHVQIENRSGRIHRLREGMKIICVFGSRYAADYYEGVVPDVMPETAHLLSRSGVVGLVRKKSSKVIFPTTMKCLGFIKDAGGRTVNTRDYSLIIPKSKTKRFPRAKMVLVCGSSMNSGKTTAAAACCLALSSKGENVRASKISGTAGLKDILYLNDSGAKKIADFSFLGFPSTYMLSENELVGIFDTLDLKYANNRDNYWIVEVADGILQRETSILLRHETIRERIHRLLYCATDPLGVYGGIEILKNRYGLTADLISGVFSGSPVHLDETADLTEIPCFNSMFFDTDFLTGLIR